MGGAAESHDRGWSLEAGGLQVRQVLAEVFAFRRSARFCRVQLHETREGAVRVSRRRGAGNEGPPRAAA